MHLSSLSIHFLQCTLIFSIIMLTLILTLYWALFVISTSIFSRGWWCSYTYPVKCHSTFHYSEVQTYLTLQYEIPVNRRQQREHNPSFWQIVSNIRMSVVCAPVSV
jgi:hypothetical protein